MLLKLFGSGMSWRLERMRIYKEKVIRLSFFFESLVETTKVVLIRCVYNHNPGLENSITYVTDTLL